MSTKAKTSKHEPDLNVTKAGTRVQVGQRWRDLDKRMGVRVCTVLQVKNGRAQMDGPKKTWVSVRRMHYHSTGWILDQVSSGPQGP